MKERAYAKINLCLDVLSPRPDGYHELRMIMAPIDFYDVLEIVPDDHLSMALDRAYLPVDEKNTVVKAIRAMQRRYGIRGDYACTLQKHIPTQAGLAGGSADAAAALRIINRLENLHLSDAELIATAKEVGSDVPFCVFNRPCLVQGAGEILEPFVCRPNFFVLLVKPRRGISTRAAFSALDQETYIHPDVEGMRRALMTQDFSGVVSCLGNSLEQVSMRLVPEIREVKEQLAEFGFEGALMSGSGSTVFGITQSRRLLTTACDQFRYRKYFTRMTRILTV